MLYCSHASVKYHTQDPVPLSNTEVSVVEMKTVETDYLGAPFTECYGKEKESEMKYDISICKTLRFVQTIMIGKQPSTVER